MFVSLQTQSETSIFKMELSGEGDVSKSVFVVEFGYGDEVLVSEFICITSVRRGWDLRNHSRFSLICTLHFRAR